MAMSLENVSVTTEYTQENSVLQKNPNLEASLIQAADRLQDYVIGVNPPSLTVQTILQLETFQKVPWLMSFVGEWERECNTSEDFIEVTKKIIQECGMKVSEFTDQNLMDMTVYLKFFVDKYRRFFKNL